MRKHIIIHTLIAAAFILILLQFPAPVCGQCEHFSCKPFVMFPDGMFCREPIIKKVGFPT